MALSLMTVWNSEKLSNLKVHVLNLALSYFSKHLWKKVISQLRKKLKVYEINQRLKLSTFIPIVFISCSAAAHMYK